MATYNRMTSEKFNAIKILLKGGATYDECAKYMQCGTSVIWRIKAAETWEEYLQMNAARAIADKKKREQQKLKEAAAKADKQQDEKPVEQPAQQDEKPVEQPVKQSEKLSQVVMFQPTHYMMEEMRKQNELLTSISNKLAYIVEMLS